MTEPQPVQEPARTDPPPPTTSLDMPFIQDFDTKQFWSLTYTPSAQEPQNIIPTGQSDPLIMFTSTYNLTVSGSKRLSIGVDSDWRVVIQVEDVRKSVKVRFAQPEWDELCQAMSNISDRLTTAYNPYSPPINIYCANLTLTVTTLYDNATLIMKSGEDGKPIYLQHGTVMNLFGLRTTVALVLERLQRGLQCIQSAYEDVVKYLRSYPVHADNLELCISSCIHAKSKPENCDDSVSMSEIKAELCAYKKLLFCKYCTTK